MSGTRTTTFDRFVHGNRNRWAETVARIGQVVARDAAERLRLRNLAREVSLRTDALEAPIEQMTSAVCPGCRNVCCINRHGWPDENDLIILLARGDEPPVHRSDLDDEAPCRYLSSTGCRLPRSRRPFRCTWYFCEALVAALDTLPGRTQRDFTEAFRRLVDAHSRVIAAYHALSTP